MSNAKTDSEARVTLSPSGRQFDVLPGRSLLDSALSAGIALPFGCANGSCGTCCARVLEGRVTKIKPHDFTLSEAEKLRGACLLCSVCAESDCLIEVDEALSVDDVPQQQLSARICRTEHVDSVSIVAFKFSRGRALRFLPGQQVNLAFSDGVNRHLPIASCPCNAQYLEFHLTPDLLPSVAHLEFLNRMLQLSSRERVMITGPAGRFTLGNKKRAPKLFIAAGGGFGQLQGMIEQVINLDLEIPFALVWQASSDTPLYRHNLCRSWQDAFDEFDYVPLEPSQDVMANLPRSWLAQLDAAEIYLCRHNPDLERELCNAGANQANIFYPENH